MELKILQLPVDYREVKQRVTRIWEDLQPQVNDSWGDCGAGWGYAAVDNVVKPQSL